MLTSGPVNATNGMYMVGHGAKATGMGGVGVAYPQDAMAAAYNPAGMTEVGESRLDLTLELFRPPRSVKHNASTNFVPTTEERSKDDLFPIPAIGAVLSAPGTPFAMGMAVVGAGLGTNYSQESGHFFDPLSGQDSYNRVGVFLMQMQMLPSIAFKASENHSLGASLVIAMQTFRAFGLEAFRQGGGGFGFSTTTETLTNRGYDWSFGWGYRLGWLGKFMDQRLNIGLNFSPRVEMQKFNRYSGLFANHGEFDIPENYAIGFAYKLTPKMNVAFDVHRILWNSVDSIGNPGPNPYDATDLNPQCPGADTDNECFLGGDKGMGFGWRNQNVYKIGFDYRYSSDLTLRAGYNYGKTPIPSTEVLFNMLAPATVEKHITFGATKKVGKTSDLTMHFMHAFKKTINGPTMFGPSGANTTVGDDIDNAAISMSQTSVGFAYGLNF
jgi:long-chain fatty acid transport protein